MGLYSGPASQASKFTDPFGDNMTARYKAATTFLQNVSPEEKQSAEWMEQSALVAKLANKGGKPRDRSLTLFDILFEGDQKQGELAKLRGDDQAPPVSDKQESL
jgi:hypothetical protein